MCLYIIGLSVSIYGQSTTNTLGEKKYENIDGIPDFDSSCLINVGTSRFQNLAHLLGKRPALIDCFATWCGPCIAAIPRLQQYQDKYGDSIRIILVTRESKEKVERFFQKNKIDGRRISLITVAGDSTLHRFFSIKALPQEVFISAAHKVLAVTNSDYLTDANIERLIQQRDLELDSSPGKLGFDPGERNSLNDSVKTRIYPYRGILTASGESKVFDSATGKTKYDIIETSIIYFYRVAYPGITSPFSIKTTILNVTDTTKLFNIRNTPKHQWQKRNYYSYESIIPNHLPDNALKEKLRQDLDSSFNYITKLVRKEIPVLIISELSIKKECSVIDQLPITDFKIDNSGNASLIIKGKSIRALEIIMNSTPELFSLPLVQAKADSPELLDMTLNLGKNYTDINIWKRELSKYAYNIEIENKTINFLSIKDAK